MNDSHLQQSEFIQKLGRIVEANLADENFGVRELAQKTRLSRTHLHRKLKNISNQSVSQFIREIRLNKAKEMLQQDLGTVSEVAYKVGFGSPSYFIKCFHDYFGYSPGVVLKMPPENIIDESTNAIKQPGNSYKSKPTFSKTGKTGSFVKVLTGSLGILLVIIITILVYRNLKAGQKSIIKDKSIAVLPFRNLSDDEENQFFADGLVEDLLNRLATINELKVISRTSSETYRNEDTKKVTKIASELGVTYILEGSVRKSENKVRITVQLIDAQRDDHVWKNTFDRDLTDIFKIQSDIALQIAEEIDLALMQNDKDEILVNKTSDFAAYEAYRMGRFYWNKRTPEGYHTSITYFEDAIAKDSLYGLAYAGLADTYNLMALQGWIDKTEGRNKAVKLAKKALKLDPSLAEAHNVLASIYTYVDWDWKLAEHEYLEAIKLNPNYSTVYHYYSEYLSIVGRHDEARKMINKAIELDPLSFVIRYVSAKLYTGQGEFNKALEELDRCDELQQSHPWVLDNRFLIYYYQKEYSKAYKVFKKYLKSENIQFPDRFESSYGEGKMEEILKWANNTHFRGYRYYAILGDYEKALDIIEEGVNTNNISPEFTFRYPYRRMHNNPRFRRILEKMNLPEK